MTCPIDGRFDIIAVHFFYETVYIIVLSFRFFFDFFSVGSDDVEILDESQEPSHPAEFSSDADAVNKKKKKHKHKFVCSFFSGKGGG